MLHHKVNFCSVFVQSCIDRLKKLWIKQPTANSNCHSQQVKAVTITTSNKTHYKTWRESALERVGAVNCVWNVMAHVQKPDFVFRRNGLVHLNRQFSLLLATEVCASAVVMLATPCSEVVWSILANYSVRQLPLHFLFRAASPCAIIFHLDSTSEDTWQK
jgi:hypothetical protein